VAGYPSVTLPIGLSDGLPAGIHFFGRAFSEDVLLGLAYALEQKLPPRAVPTYIPREE
jgi:amidase